MVYLPAQGRLAQLVQSTSFTPRGSGVRIPHALKITHFYSEVFLCLIFYSQLVDIHCISSSD